MALVKLAFRPGVELDGTRYSSQGGWTDMDKVRFHDGKPEKIGGWQKETLEPFVGACRSLHSWSDLDGNIYLGIGTHLKFYVERGGGPNDITPIRSTAALVNPFATTISSATVTVTDVAHGAGAGDFVTFSGAAAVGGLTLNNEYQIVTVLTPDTYTITAASAASSTVAAGGGAAVSAAYQINVGLDTSVFGNGWGAGTWGGDVLGGTDTGWGDAATSTTAGATLRLWSQDNYGEDLVINPRDGAIYYWDASAGLGTRAVLLSTLSGAADVPTVCRHIIATDSDRKVLAFGCNDVGASDQDRLLIRWSDTEDPAMWTPLETNSAGGIRIPTGSEFLAAVETKAEVLVWSDAALHSLRYIGAPYEYGITRVGLTSVLAPYAVVATNDVVFWMGSRGFYRYDGRIVPVPCPVEDHVFDDINLPQADKVVGGCNSSFNEVWWFYPSLGSAENDRYVVYNYVENVWSVGELPRTAWIDRGIEDYPRAASTDGFIYYHEYGQDDGSQNPPVAVSAHIESGPLEIGEGDQFGFAWRMIPDVDFRNSSAAEPAVTMVLKADAAPGSAFLQTSTRGVTATVPVTQFTEQTFFRLRGRSVTLRVESSGTGVAWRLGIPRLDVRPDGRR